MNSLEYAEVLRLRRERVSLRDETFASARDAALERVAELENALAEVRKMFDQTGARGWAGVEWMVREALSVHRSGGDSA